MLPVLPVSPLLKNPLLVRLLTELWEVPRLFLLLNSLPISLMIVLEVIVLILFNIPLFVSVLLISS